ncbi:MAG: gluconate 2-dehydrogenase subunit 3 family protein [Acidobacteriota bacterium]
MSNHTELVQLGEVSRRGLLRSIAMAVTAVAGGRMKLEAAQHVHQHAAAEKKKSGGYQPKLFNDHEFKTLGRLAEIIVPADERSGSARDAGAPEFIDLLCSQNDELATIFTGGLLWLDSEMQDRGGASFVAAPEADQIAMIEALVEGDRRRREIRESGETYEGNRIYTDFRNYGTEKPASLSAGIYFFDWLRRMTVDAFYTSEIGIKDLGYVGNGAVSTYEVPQEAIDYVLKHSPFGA